MSELKFADNKEERSFYAQYDRLGPSDTPTLRIVDNGDYYTLLGADAQWAADNVYKSSSVLKSSGQQQYVTVSPSVLSVLLKTALTEEAFRVEIYDRKWTLLKSASPGNLESLEDLMEVSSTVIGGLVVNQDTLGLSFIDVSQQQIGWLEIVDNECFSNLESFLVQCDIKELCVAETCPKNCISLIERCGVVATKLPSKSFNAKDTEDDLARLLSDELMLKKGISKHALSSCSGIISYLGLMSDDKNFSKFSLIHHNLNEFMRLDVTAVKALNVFGEKSLYSTLNHCKSQAGSRLLSQWLKQPLTDMHQICSRQELVGQLVEDLSLRQTLQSDYLSKMPDIRRITKKLNKSPNLEDVVKLYQFASKVPHMVELLGDIPQWLEPLLEYTEPLSKFTEMVEQTVDLEHDLIKAEFDPELAEFRVKLDTLTAQVSEQHLEIQNDLGLADGKLKLENHHMHGWCLRLTRTDAKIIRGQKQFIELSTVKAGIFFTTKHILALAEEISTLQKTYDEKQRALVLEIVGITGTYTPVFHQLSQTVAMIDVIASLAHVAAYAPQEYIKPTFSTDRSSHAIEARHPILENIVAYIPSTTSLQPRETAIITGPNMGGKSTYIRTLALMSLMAQIGSFVPCNEGTTLPIYDAILARVGAGDSQLKGLSTFMSEMLDMSSILRCVTANSLVVIDELGRGTSTYDGFGLAWAISKHLATVVGCHVLFATHFHELTGLSNVCENVKNYQVVAEHSDVVTMLYTVVPGICDESFGVGVAEMVGFPSKIVRMAKRKAQEMTQDTEALKQVLKRWKSDCQGISDPAQCVDKLKSLVAEHPEISDMLRDL